MASVEQQDTPAAAVGEMAVENPATGEVIAHVPELPPERVAELARQGRVLPRLVDVGDQRVDRAARRGTQAHRDLQPSPLDRGLDHAAGIELERREEPGQAEGDVEAPVVQRLALDQDGQADSRHFGPTVPRHAADHLVSGPVNSGPGCVWGWSAATTSAC